ncbi:MAG: hypothetical protein ACRCXX_13770 [Cetobacterium sp.]|uniref:hypothetical protein n=1 Tax=Cetobacterium sp. TaxID=2071632 RepID=UPI003F397E9A
MFTLLKEKTLYICSSEEKNRFYFMMFLGGDIYIDEANMIDIKRDKDFIFSLKLVGKTHMLTKTTFKEIKTLEKIIYAHKLAKALYTKDNHDNPTFIMIGADQIELLNKSLKTM